MLSVVEAFCNDRKKSRKQQNKLLNGGIKIE